MGPDPKELPDVRLLDACFLGPSAENQQLLEELLLEFLRDHGYWRRNFHPDDPPAFSTADRHDPEYLEFSGRIRDELYRLSADLKKAVPFFSPRYVGHMSSDILLPAFVAKIVTTLYNPNNVSEDAAPATLEKELEVGRQLARMFGMSCDETQEPCAWGHLTSGGTVANYEALWNFRAVKFYPHALAVAARELELEAIEVPAYGKGLTECSDWELANLSIDQVVALRRASGRAWLAGRSLKEALALAETVRAQRIERLGLAGFFQQHATLKSPIVLVPSSAHYSWEKGMKVLGLGSANLVTVDVDDHMRMEAGALERALDRALEEQTPILAAVGVLGTTEFGTIDPVHELVRLRDQSRPRGLDFGIHVDAAWGGYLASMFRRPDGGFHDREEMTERFQFFPSEAVHSAFKALSEVDSITIDPHKLGYVPYAAGAFVARNREIVDFVTQKAAYVFDLGAEATEIPTSEKLRNLGQYVLEGSKPGSSAAAVDVTHRVLPLDSSGMGRVIDETVRATESLHQLVLSRNAEVEDRCHIRIPFVSDSNLICLALNPRGNDSLAAMNRFGRRLFDHMKVDPDAPIQTRQFIGSYTSLVRGHIAGDQANRLLQDLGIDPATFRSAPEDPERDANHIFLLRHTLMNPWLRPRRGHRDYLKLYWEYLVSCIDEALTE